MALDSCQWSICWEGEAKKPHLPSSPATERPVKHMPWEGVSLERIDEPEKVGWNKTGPDGT